MADATTITDAELESFRERIGDLLLASEVCYSGGAYCFALAHFGTHAGATPSQVRRPFAESTKR
ncbi:DUF6000 family protein [Streptomyces sp. NPDC058682]|uniref:DUF6000 family protein n=1 Tax=Streptomyces sp. NPDC058682 TaxID=3346596 RepID=UPI0036683689